MPDYVKLAATANRLVTESGRNITLVRKSRTPKDVSKPWLGNTDDETTLVVPGVQMMPAAVRIFGLAALGDSSEFRGLVRYAELVYVVFQGENDLKNFTIVRDGGIDYKIEATQTLKPANTTLLGFIGVSR